MRIRTLTRWATTVVMLTALAAAAASALTVDAQDRASAALGRQIELRDRGAAFADAVTNASNLARRFAAAGDEATATSYGWQTGDDNPRDRGIASLRALGLTVEEDAMLAEATRSAQALESLDKLAVKVGQSGNLERARELVFDESYEIQRVDVMSSIGRLQRAVNDRAQRQVDTARAEADRLLGVTMAAVLLLAVGLPIVLLGLYERRVVGPLGELNDTVSRLRAEELDAPVPHLGLRNEIGALARSLELMRESQIQNRQLQTELQRLATTDPLTGASNRRAFLHAAEGEVQRHHRYGTRFAVVMCDIDYFKKINDGYGHATGDTALKATVKAFREGMRAADTIGRIGGEEFALLLPAVDEAGAVTLAERLRERIAAIVVTADDGREVRFTCSFGVSGPSEGETSIEPALLRADAALYAAKTGGRNRVVRLEVDPSATGAGAAVVA